MRYIRIKGSWATVWNGKMNKYITLPQHDLCQIEKVNIKYSLQETVHAELRYHLYQRCDTVSASLHDVSNHKDFLHTC